MLTVTWRRECGGREFETSYSAIKVRAMKKLRSPHYTVDVYTKDNVCTGILGPGMVYVMNAEGKTVQSYDLGPDPSGSITKACTLDAAIVEAVLEADEDELREIVGAERFEKLASRGRGAAERALAQARSVGAGAEARP